MPLSQDLGLDLAAIAAQHETKRNCPEVNALRFRYEKEVIPRLERLCKALNVAPGTQGAVLFKDSGIGDVYANLGNAFAGLIQE